MLFEGATARARNSRRSSNDNRCRSWCCPLLRAHGRTIRGLRSFPITSWTNAAASSDGIEKLSGVSASCGSRLRENAQEPKMPRQRCPELFSQLPASDKCGQHNRNPARIAPKSRPPAFAGDGRERYTAPAFCAYSQEAFDSGTVRLADSMALALAAVPSRMRPAMPWVMPASRNRL